MKEYQIPILIGADTKSNHYTEELSLKVSTWFKTRIEYLYKVWSHSSIKEQTDLSTRTEEIVDKIIKILTHRKFNYQSKVNLTGVAPNVKQDLLKQIKQGKPINFYLLYNGGYRTSPLQNHLSLIFEPDQTELLLLYQISLLKDKISTIYSPGIEFFIVVNNGVAKWVNDIPIKETTYYANQLKKMIDSFGAERSIKVLLQSELHGFESDFSFRSFDYQQELTADDHFIVERFLGRSCSREEAAYRLGLYHIAEAKWAEDLSPIITSNGGIVMRQVAHPKMLSFRPFPGGAIRIQNGTFGFQYQNNSLSPKLITTKSTNEHYLQWVSFQFQK